MASPSRRRRSTPIYRTRRPDQDVPGPGPGPHTQPGDPASGERSDARRLQAALEVRYRAPAPLPRWSRRRTLAFVVVASATLWGLLIAVAAGVVRLIA